MKQIGDLTLTQIQEINQANNSDNLQSYNVFVLRNIMLETIVPY
jgi:hypothetical protein